MGVDDLFEFDSAAYAKMLRDLSTPQLKAREKEKIRQFLSSSCSLGIDGGSLAAMAGLSVIWMGFSARRLDVSNKKLDLIRAEIAKRGAPLKEKPSWVDKRVAVVGGLASLVVGDAVQDGLEAGGGGSEGGGAGGTPSFEEVFQSNVAGSAAAGVSRDLMERFETKEWKDDMRAALGCKRLAGMWPGARSLYCDSCGVGIEQGLFAHCCECDDNYDLCHSCRGKGLRCPQATAGHEMATRQIAVDGLSDRKAAKRMLRLKSVRCDSCKEPIRQGRLYACVKCKRDSGCYDLCPNCYYNGATCLVSQEHSLYVFLAGFNPVQNESAYTKIHGCGIAKCNHCSKDIWQGLYFQCRCFSCQAVSGFFDTCYRCYEKGSSCRDTNHPLALILAYNHTCKRRDVYEGNAVCDACKKHIDGDIWFHCNKCARGKYDLCSLCYFMGWRCPDGKHSFDRVV